jgi:hypothetical protein
MKTHKILHPRCVSIFSREIARESHADSPMINNGYLPRDTSKGKIQEHLENPQQGHAWRCGKQVHAITQNASGTMAALTNGELCARIFKKENIVFMFFYPKVASFRIHDSKSRTKPYWRIAVLKGSCYPKITPINWINKGAMLGLDKAGGPKRAR